MENAGFQSGGGALEELHLAAWMFVLENFVEAQLNVFKMAAPSGVKQTRFKSELQLSGWRARGFQNGTAVVDEPHLTFSKFFVLV
eukprot:4194702-Pyramimonas_sp.AAC.1